MKILEIADMPGTRPLVYVDMDGVLADFFGQLARHHGQTHWKKVGGGDIIVKTAASPGFFRGLPKLDQADELVRGDDVFFVATGITDGELLTGVRYRGGSVRTHSMVMRSRSGTIRIIESEHKLDKLKAYASIDFGSAN